MENKQINIISLISEKEMNEKKLSNLIYGSIEIREKQNNKYIYVHYREEGLSLTKYVGEYTDELYNLILKNNIEVKKIKKDIRHINKELSKLNYVENSLDEKVKINIDFAKKHLVDSIYKQAVLEGIATTYLDTETIIEGGKVNNMTPNDILKIVNLKRAWEFILNETVITTPISFSILSEINKLVEEGFYYNAGKIRSVPVNIGGTTWKPNLPIESLVKEQLEDIINSELQPVDKAIELLLYVMKTQIFIDGNKRTAVIFANHLLISKGKGLIIIPNDLVSEYRKLLIDYYEGKDELKIKVFLKEKCFMKI